MANHGTSEKPQNLTEHGLAAITRGIDHAIQHPRITLPIAAAALAWYALYTQTGHNPMWPTLIIASTALIAAIITRHQLKQQIIDSQTRRDWQNANHHCGIKNTPQITQIDRLPAGERYHLQVGHGISMQTLENHADQLATELGAAEITVKANRHNRKLGHIDIIRRDPLADSGTIPWPHLQTLPQLSGWDPAALGITATGEQIGLRLPERNLLIGGLPRMGKSVSMSLMLAHFALSPDTKIWLIDGKRGVEFAPWAETAEGIATTQSQGVDMLRHIQTLMDQRYEQIAERQEAEQRVVRKVEQGDFDWPLHIVFTDELRLFAAGPDTKAAKTFTAQSIDIVARSGAAGVIAIFATQRPSAVVIDTDLRGLILYRLALRCADIESSKMILGSDSYAEGWNAASLTQPGLGILRSEDTYTKLRGYNLSDADVYRVAKEAAKRRQTQAAAAA